MLLYTASALSSTMPIKVNFSYFITLCHFIVLADGKNYSVNICDKWLLVLLSLYITTPTTTQTLCCRNVPPIIGQRLPTARFHHCDKTRWAIKDCIYNAILLCHQIMSIHHSSNSWSNNTPIYNNHPGILVSLWRWPPMNLGWPKYLIYKTLKRSASNRIPIQVKKRFLDQ
jgi:hypothetical protein